MKEHVNHLRIRHALHLVAAIALVLLSSTSALAVTVTAIWNANPESDISGYVLSYGTSSGSYTTNIDVGNVTSGQVTLTSGRYYFAVRAYNASGQISAYSTQVVYDVPSSPAIPALTSLSPTSGSPGMSITVNGSNFGASQGSSTVRFNGTTATVSSWTASQIVATVPSGATSGTVVVTVGGVASNGLNFSVTAPPAGLPSPWLSQNIGSPSILGVATHASGVFTISGAGSDIWGTGDQFNFVYQTLNGNGEIVARVNSLLSTDPWAKAGVMIRENLTAGARNVMSDVSSENGPTFQRRITASGTSTSDWGFSAAVPQWVRLVRNGNTFTGYYSATGASWTQMGTIDVPMAAQVYVGLAVTSHTALQLTTASFSNVSVTTATPPTPVPSITSLSPSTGLVGTSVTISGSNFGTVQGSSTVRFNGTAATPISWGASSIVVPVPGGATTGPVIVTVDGQASNSPTFTMQGAPPPPASITLRQDGQIDAGTAQSSSLAFSSSVTAGDLLAVVVRGGRSNQTFTVTDSRGRTYTEAARKSGFDHTVAIYYTANTTGGANTVTVSQGTSSALRFVILEFSGVATTSPLDVSGTSSGWSSSPSASATTTTGGALLIGAVASSSARTYTAGSGYTVAEAISAAPNTRLLAEWRVQAGSGSTSAGATLSSSTLWSAAVVAFKPAPGGSSLMSLGTDESEDVPGVDPGPGPDVPADDEPPIDEPPIDEPPIDEPPIEEPPIDEPPARVQPPASDYDGDGRADPATYRPSTGRWRVLTADSNYTEGLVRTWGVSSDVLVPGDYDGDGKTDLAYYRPSTGDWSILLSGSGLTQMLDLVIGGGFETPVPADYDGDGATDVAVYDSKTGQWHVLLSSAGFGAEVLRNWGSGSDVPVPGDYDGDGKADPAVYSPATGEWKIVQSSTDYAATMSVTLGSASDVPVPADYDGDGTTEVAVFRPSTAEWHIMRLTDGLTGSIRAGVSGTPVPLDFDGDGKADLAVFLDGVWRVQLSSADYAPALSIDVEGYGDVPLPTRP